MILRRQLATLWLVLLCILSFTSAESTRIRHRNAEPRQLQQAANNNNTMEANNEFLGIPGTTQTLDGYDTALGTQAICWKGAAADLQNSTNYTATSSNNDEALDLLVKTVFPNPLVENFTLLGRTEILKKCPQGNVVTVQHPIEKMRGERLRTLRYYNYTLHVEIDLDTLDGDYIVTDDGNATIALQVVTCSLGKSGFCSPFVHEQANAREAIEKHNSGAEIVTTKKKVKGDLHGGTHIHSPWVFLDMGSNRTISKNVTIPMIVNIPDEYFVLGTVQLYTGINGSNAYRWDFANALEPEGRYVLYQDPPTIMSVTQGVLIASYISISIASIAIVALIVQTFRHKHHQVLQLSQGDFLLVFLFCALISTVCVFLYNPKSDIYCRFSNPIVVVPIQLMYAITVGRMWRIHAVISPLLLEHLSKGSPGITQRFVEGITSISFKLHNLFTKKDKHRKSSGGAKQQISQFQLALVVSIFTLPQAVLQLVAFIAQPQKMLIDYNSNESLGRQTCGSGVAPHHDLVNYGFLMLLLLVIILMVMAHSSRKLPSLFNETHVIYDSTFLSVVLLLLGGAVIVLTNDPETSPDVEYLVKMVLVLSITLNSAVRILYPKLQKVWKNEHVIVSKLVTDHHRKTREKQADRSSVIRGSAIHVSGIDMSNSNKYHESFTKFGGDYDLGQTNRLMTIHSCSESGTNYGRSSVSSGDGLRRSNPFNSTEDSLVASDQGDPIVIEPASGQNQMQLESIKESPAKEHSFSKERRKAVLPGSSSTDPTSSFEFDIESGAKGALPDQVAANNKPLQQGTNDDEFVAKEAAQSDDGELSITLEATGRNSLDREKKASLFDQGPSFLRSAMKKGMSSLGITASKSEKHVGSTRDSERAQEKSSGRSTKVESERNAKQSERSHKKLAKKIVVAEDETPARRLVLKMLDLQDQLESVNNKIMSGLAVSQDDWNAITKLTSKLDSTFSNEVEFEWDLEKRYQEELDEILPLDMSGHGGSGRSWTASNKKKEAEDIESPISKKNIQKKEEDAKSRSSLKSARLKGIKRKASTGQHQDLLGGGSNHSLKSFASDTGFASDDNGSFRSQGAMASAGSLPPLLASPQEDVENREEPLLLETSPAQSYSVSGPLQASLAPRTPLPEIPSTKSPSPVIPASDQSPSLQVSPPAILTSSSVGDVSNDSNFADEVADEEELYFI